jgi:hypothetical protein
MAELELRSVTALADQLGLAYKRVSRGLRRSNLARGERLG